MGAFAFNVFSYTAIFVVIATGLILVVQLMGLYNFAHGEFLLVGGMCCYFVQGSGMSPWAGIVLAPLAGFGVGWLADRVLLSRVYRIPTAAVLSTFAIGLAMRELSRLQLGGQYVSIEAPLPGTFEFFGVTLPVWRACVLVVCIVTGLALWLAMRHSRYGLQLRAVLDNERLARATGLKAARINTIAFSAAAALTAGAGALIAPVLSVHADMGLPFLIKAFLAAVLGSAWGLGGGLAAASVIGIVSSVLPLAVDAVVADAIVLIGAVVALRFLSRN